MRNLPKNTLKSRKAKVAHGPGECWYYIVPRGLELCVAQEKGKAASQIIRLTRRQLERALEIMEEVAK